jgi:RNA-directed DNA polymerase
MSLETPDNIRSLQRKLYRKAKAEPAFRFYILYDKVCREDILLHAYALARANAGAPGVDRVTFGEIEASGVEAWLAGLREDLVSKNHRPDPVRRVMIPKPGGGERPLGIPANPGPGGSGCGKDRVGANLRGGLRGWCLRLSAASKRD